MDHFERLGLPRRFLIDAAELERAYLARSRAIHPDYHQLGSSADQVASVELSAALNEAYTTLKEPFRRAEYLMTLANGPSASEQKDVPLDFLDEMLELRMEIGQLKAETPAALAMESQLQERRDQLLAKVGALLEADDDRSKLVEARRLLNATKYVANLLRDLRSL